MPEQYGIVNWYFEKKGFDFEDWADKQTRDGVKEESAEDFFDKIMDYAKGQAETSKKAESLSGLKGVSKFKSVSIGQIKGESDFDVGVNESFDNRLKDMIPSSLPSKYQSRLKSRVSRTNNKEDFKGLVKEYEEDYKEALRQEKEMRRKEEEKFERERQRKLEVRRKEKEIARRITEGEKESKVLGEFE